MRCLYCIILLKEQERQLTIFIKCMDSKKVILRMESSICF